MRDGLMDLRRPRKGKWNHRVSRDLTPQGSPDSWMIRPPANRPRALTLAGVLVLVAALLLAAGPGAVAGHPGGELGLPGVPREILPRLQAATPLANEEPSACTLGENLLPNAGFESGADAWFIDESVEPTSAEAYEGRGSMRLGAPDEDAYMDHGVSPVMPGATYTLSGWGKLSAGGESGEIGVQYYDSAGERLTAEEPAPLTFTGTEFEEQRLTFTLPAQVSEVYVYGAKVAGPADFYVDALSLILCQEEPAPAATPVATPDPVALATPAPDDSAAPSATAASVATTAPSTPEPAASAAGATSDRSGCDPAYPEERTCIPPGPPFAQGCAITEERNFTVLPPDPQGLDRDRDGIGCEPIHP